MQIKILFLLVSSVLSACSPPLIKEVKPPSTLQQSVFDELFELEKPISQKLIVGVYSFTDQTGQRAVLDRQTSSMSSAIPQGLSSLLVQELKLAGGGEWYRVVERESIQDIINERRIVSSALGENAEEQLPQWLLPGLILTGGAVSYDRKIYDNFKGFGISSINSNSQVQSDQVGIILRAVSVQTGEVLESVYASKEVLSQVNGVSGLKILNTTTMAFEAGTASNEPVSLAVRKAIASAIFELTKRGIENDWWAVEAAS
jgi:curli production assembly/transport component CsgG